MEAYQIGLSALKNSFSDLPLNEDKVQDTLFELESALEQHRDIENILSTTIGVEEGTESDLEEELMDILAAAAEPSGTGVEQEEELFLPSVPTDSPRAAAITEKEKSAAAAAQRLTV